MTVQDVLDVLFRLAPIELKEEWDNVGLLCGSRATRVEKALIALDPTLQVLHEAKETGCNLVITHHPILFGSIRELSDDSPTGKALLYSAENKISCVNLHTKLDCVSGGVNDVLAERLGLQDVSVLFPRGKDANGDMFGYVHSGTVAPCSLLVFLDYVKRQLGCTALRYVDGGSSVFCVAVGGGECADELHEVAAAGCDTFVTADVKYHQFLDAAALGLSLIDAGHFQTENPVCDYLLRRLSEELPQLSVQLSKKHSDVICFC